MRREKASWLCDIPLAHDCPSCVGSAAGAGDGGDAASGMDQHRSGWRRGHVHTRNLPRGPEPDPLELRHERRLSLDGRRQELGVDSLQATDQLDERASGLASR